jgi:glycosyltransferase involved in cell wall biosynthesis
MFMGITAIILTYNEEIHLERCIQSLKSVCERICIVDSYSTDSTVSIAEKLGAEVFQNKWENNYAKQLNWGIQNCNISSEWIMRMDADEYLLPELQNEINQKMGDISPECYGIEYSRRVIFKGKWIKFGGFYPIRLLRIWRKGFGICEERLMDEHIVLSKGEVERFENDVVDENLNPIHWWVNKHNNYSRREATDLLNQKYDFLKSTVLRKSNSVKQAAIKRFLKNKVYLNLPLGIRPMMYFLFRFFIQLGILDGPKGWIFHFLQGFWYRLIVDINVYEAEKESNGNREKITNLIKNKWLINLD